MGKVVFIILIVVIILGILGIIYKSKYNKLVNNKIKIDEAKDIVLQCLKEKKLIILDVASIVRKKIKMEIENFNQVENIDISENYNYEDDKKLEDAYKTLKHLAEDYPKLTKDEKFKEFMNSLEENSEKLTAAKDFSDKYATVLNNLIRGFPNNLIGFIHRIKKVEFYNVKRENSDSSVWVFIWQLI